MRFSVLLSSAFTPVREKLCLALVSQGMVEQLIDYLKGHCRYVSAHSRCFDHVYRMTHACRQNFSFPIVVPVDLNDVLEQQQTVFSDVVEPAKERADERSARFGCHDGLRCGKA